MLIGGQWLSVGGINYNRQINQGFNSQVNQPNYFQGYDNQVVTLYDLQKPCKIVQFGFSNVMWTTGSSSNNTTPKPWVKELRIYIDDVLAKTFSHYGNSPETLEIGRTYDLFRSQVGELQANRRLRIEATIGMVNNYWFQGALNVLYHE